MFWKATSCLSLPLLDPTVCPFHTLVTRNTCKLDNYLFVSTRPIRNTCLMTSQKTPVLGGLPNLFLIPCILNELQETNIFSNVSKDPRITAYWCSSCLSAPTGLPHVSHTAYINNWTTSHWLSFFIIVIILLVNQCLPWYEIMPFSPALLNPAQCR